jgi:acyl-CoA dehydrogenase
MNGGELPRDLRARHRRLAKEIGLQALGVPKTLGGAGLSFLEQVVIQEEIGKATNALGWCYDSTPPWLIEACACSPYQMENWVKPNIRGERHECYAITEVAAGSDVGAIEATALRDGDDYVLNGEKWHVTGTNQADHFVFQASLANGPLCRTAGDSIHAGRQLDRALGCPAHDLSRCGRNRFRRRPEA